MGLYVSQLGLDAARSVNLPSITKYLQWLQALAVACVLMRIAWIFDVVIQMQAAVDKAVRGGSQDGSDSGTGSGTDSGSSDGSSTVVPTPGAKNGWLFNDDFTGGSGTGTNGQVMDQRVVTSFAVQVMFYLLNIVR